MSAAAKFSQEAEHWASQNHMIRDLWSAAERQLRTAFEMCPSDSELAILLTHLLCRAGEVRKVQILELADRTRIWLQCFSLDCYPALSKQSLSAQDLEVCQDLVLLMTASLSEMTNCALTDRSLVGYRYTGEASAVQSSRCRWAYNDGTHADGHLCDRG